MSQPLEDLLAKSYIVQPGDDLTMAQNGYRVKLVASGSGRIPYLVWNNSDMLLEGYQDDSGGVTLIPPDLRDRHSATEGEHHGTRPISPDSET